MSNSLFAVPNRIPVPNATRSGSLERVVVPEGGPWRSMSLPLPGTSDARIGVTRNDAGQGFAFVYPLPGAESSFRSLGFSRMSDVQRALHHAGLGGEALEVLLDCGSGPGNPRPHRK
jgi:hypothetical protein